LSTVATAALATTAIAEPIDTTPAWNGTNFISSWGVPNTATYGQTITATTTQSRLTDFTFYLNQQNGTAPQYQAFVYQWDDTTRRIVGPALYTSGIMTAPSGSVFNPVTISTGGVLLTPGQQYVLFLTTSTVSGQANGSYRWGSVGNNTTYAGGQFVFQNNGTNFGNLSTANWSFIAEDLAFIAALTPTQLALLLPPGAPTNPTNVANGIDAAVLGGAAIPPGFLGLYNLSGSQLTAALGQLTGENNTGAQQGAVQIMNSFISVMLNPLADNRGGGGFGAIPYAQEQEGVAPAVNNAYASVLKAPPMQPAPESRYRVWGGAYGGVNRTSGDAAVGSNDTTSNVVGFAAGVDYRVSPDTLIGFALAGGGTSWSLSNGMGDGKSDVFQAGLYGSQKFGQAYMSAAFAFSSFWIDTDRYVSVAGTDHLTASFDAYSYGGRLEGGYHIPFTDVTFTPYAAVQAQTFHTPSYGETADSGSAQFALNYGSRDGTTVRSELGSWASHKSVFTDGTTLSLFGRAAWGHDWQSDPTLSATFLALPTASFVVNGAEASSDLALLTAGAEMRWRNGWAVMAKFDGEFGGNTQTYSGTGRLRYTW
jgi:uncharacterized protein with beta-barrel porin domain